ncbi:unnamed protein product [Sphagnum jensenii]|uniref:Uncharacterized protein n=1 Tax=Sphagnum jensenii TaxID=128206 RepID=A0ABP0V6G6_9BRYO
MGLGRTRHGLQSATKGIEVIAMKKLVWLCFAFCVTATFGQQITPNIGLQIPATGSNNWYIPLNYDFSRIDQYLGGQLTVPALTVGTLTVTNFTLNPSQIIDGLGYTPLNPANNLLDISNKTTALANLGGIGVSSVKGVWSASVTYDLSNVVTYAGSTYISLASSNLNNNPASSSGSWILFVSAGGSATFPFSGIVYSTSATAGRLATSADIVTLANTSPSSTFSTSLIPTLNQSTTGNAATATTTAQWNGVSITGTPSVGYVPTATASNAASWQPSGLNGVTVSGTPSANQVLTATSSSAANWQSPTGAVSSVFGRSGAVSAQTNDYSFSQIGGSLTATQIAAAGSLSNSTTGNAATATTASNVPASGLTATATTASNANSIGGVTVSGTPSANQVLIATSSSAASWQTNTGGVSTVFGRSGAVTAQTGDYSFSQIGGQLSLNQYLWNYASTPSYPASGTISEQLTSIPAYPYIIKKQSAPAPLNATFPTDFGYKISQLVPDATTYPVSVVVTAGAINTATIGSGGTGYVVGDTVTVVQSGASGGEFTVTAVSSGVVTAVSKLAANWGTGYTTATGLSTTGGTGSGLTLTIASTVNVATATITSGAFPIAPLVNEYAQVVGSTTAGINATPAAITAASVPTTTSFSYTTTASAGTAAGSITAAIYDSQLEGFQDATALDNFNGYLYNRGVNESGSLMGIGTIVQVSSTTNALNLPSITTLGCASGGVYPTAIGVLQGLVPIGLNPATVGNTGVGGFTHEGYGAVQMDSSTGLTAGDFIVPSTTTCYYGHDSGVSSYTSQTTAVTPVGAPIIGIISTVNGSTVRARFVDMTVTLAGGSGGGSGTVTTTNTATVGNVATILSTGTSSGNPTAVVGPGDMTDTVGTGVTVSVPVTVNSPTAPSEFTLAYNQTTGAATPAVVAGAFSVAPTLASASGTGTLWNMPNPGLGAWSATSNSSGSLTMAYVPYTGNGGNVMSALPNVKTATAGTITCMDGSGNVSVSGCGGAFLTNPMTALGDTIYGGASAGSPTRLAGPTTNATWVLSEIPTAGAAVAPAWTNLTTTLASQPGGCTFSTLGATATMSAAATNVTAVTGNIPANCIPANGVVHLSFACTVSVASGQTASTFTPQLVFYDASSTKTFPITATGATGSVAAGTSNLITGTADIMAPASGTGGSWGYGLVQAQNTSGTITNVAGLYNRVISFVAQSSTLPTLIYGSTGNQIQVLMQTSVANTTANSSTCNLSGHN